MSSGGTLTAVLSDGSAANFTRHHGHRRRSVRPQLHTDVPGRRSWKDADCDLDDDFGHRECDVECGGAAGSGSGSIVATAGTSQSTTVNTAFTTALQVTVTSGGNPVNGATVTFTAPATGASGSFSTGTTATAMTNASGVATAPTLTANTQSGGYSVTASVSGAAAPASFSLTNNAGPAASITASAGTLAERDSEHGICDGAAGYGHKIALATRSTGRR